MADNLSAHPEKTDITNTDHLGLLDDEMPPGYFRSSFFLGSMLAIGLGLLAGVAGFGYAAPILGLINADVGPDPNIVWVALVYTLMIAVSLTIIGRVTDIFGRRYVFIGGAAFGLIGSIVCATAKSVGALIGGGTLIGLGAATQLSYYYIMGELVPMKYRFIGNAAMYIFTIPGSGFAPAIGNALILHTKSGWRGLYYILIAVNACSMLCFILFYHPPTFHMKHRNSSKTAYAKKFDYIGCVVYSGGLLILLLGLNWGGSVYAWKSAHVIATIVIGVVALVAFILWETFAKLEEPLVPMHLFKNGRWIAAVVTSGLGAGLYYAFAIVWPSMVTVLYADGNQMYGGMLSSLVGLGIILGEIVSGFSAKAIGKVRWQCTASFAIGGILFACVATCTPDTRARACALSTLGVFFIGWSESIAITLTTISINNQQEIGTAGGVAGSIRFLISSISATVYSVILSNRLATTIPEKVIPAITGAGLPSSSIATFLAGFTTGSFDKVEGLTPQILAAGSRAYKVANADAYRTVFLTTIAFTGIAVTASLFLPNVEDRMTGKVATALHNRGDENVVGA
ncbi:MFS general substrate transporter [Lophium mytilinum]|uniref:MFS general substrate transporter n=1 Tax=Lophium mytilinum TaxID=390894 RepID=A0A6A6R615_9PEZI|nr:MFS general substrate transporter [Lophium mytilinum]